MQSSFISKIRFAHAYFWLFVLGITPGAAYQLVEEGDVLYFNSPGNQEISRYHLPSKGWFTNWSFSGQVYGIGGDAGNVYYLLGSSLMKRAIATEIDTEIISSIDRSDLLHVHGSWVFLVHEVDDSLIKLTTRNSENGGILDELTLESKLFYNATLLTGDPSRLYFYSGDWNRAVIRELEINADGTFGELRTVADAPGGGDEYLFYGRLHPVENGALLYDTLGRGIRDGVLSASDRITQFFDLFCEYGDYYAAAVPGTIWLIDKTSLAAVKRRDVQGHFQFLRQVGDELLGFAPYGGGFNITSSTLEDFEDTQTVELIPTSERQFLPAPGWIDKNEVIHLPETYYGANTTIHRWDVKNRKFLPPFRPLQDTFNFVYHPHHDALYVIYNSGHTSRIDLSDPELRETTVLKEESSFAGILSAGDQLIVNYCAYNKDLEKIQRLPGFPKDYRMWGNQRKRVYTFQAGQVYWADQKEDGTYTEELGPRPFPFFPGVDPDPVFSQDGTQVFLAGGNVMNTENFVQTWQLPNINKDFEWHNNRMFSIGQDSVWIYNTDPYPKFSEIRRWKEDLTVDLTKILPGRPIQLFSSSEGLVLAVETTGKIRFYLLDQNLNVLHGSRVPESASGLMVNSRSPAKLLLDYVREEPTPTSVDFEYFDPVAGDWKMASSIETDKHRELFANLSAETDYHFRIADKIKEQVESYLDRVIVTRFGQFSWGMPSPRKPQYRVQILNRENQLWEDLYQDTSEPDTLFEWEIGAVTTYEPLEVRLQYRNNSSDEWITSNLENTISVKTRISTAVYLGNVKPFLFRVWPPGVNQFTPVGMGFLTPGGFQPKIYEHVYPGPWFAGYDVVEPQWEEPKTYDMVTIRTPSAEEAGLLDYSVMVEEGSEGGSVEGNQQVYGYDELISLMGNPSPGFVFSHWSGVEDTNIFRARLTLPADINLYLKAHFIPESAWEIPVVSAEIRTGFIHLISTTKHGLSYEVQHSADLVTWSTIGGPFPGTGSLLEWEGALNDSESPQFYRLWAHPFVPD